jgi:hypothetical protein
MSGMFDGFKVISGGQSGVDSGALEAAYEAGLETGGTAPKGYRTENGPNLELLRKYGLVESSAFNYNHRTKQNILDSDATVIFADLLHSPGTQLTMKLALENRKLVLINPSPQQLIEFIAQFKIKTLNVAGNRESIAPGIFDRTKKILLEAFKCQKNIK